MKKVHQLVCQIEEYFCATLLTVIVALSFVTAVARCINHPISWTIEVSQLLLAWLAFIGADMAFRSDKIMGVDIITRKFPPKVQIAIRFVMNILMLAMLVFFIKYGYILCVSNLKRSFQTVGVSYAWATASLPVASAFMGFTAIENIVMCAKKLFNKKMDDGKEENPA